MTTSHRNSLALRSCGRWVYRLCLCGLSLSGLVACSLVETESAPVDVHVGGITLTRWEIDPDQYCLSLSVFNGTDHPLESYTVSALFAAPAGDEPSAEEAITAPLQVATEMQIAPESSSGVDIVFRSPLAFVPPPPVTLSEIRFHSFRFADEGTGDGVIVYPYPLQEE